MKKLIRTLLIILLVFLVICWKITPILSLTERFLVVSETPQKSDVIVVLSGAALTERIRHAVKLWKEGYAPKMLMSGHLLLQKETGVDLMKMYAVQLGVKPEVIIRESESQTTWENASASKKIILKENFHSVLLVTSAHHTRRAKQLFRKALPPEIRLTVSSEPLPPFETPWWKNDIRLRLMIHEYLSYVWMVMAGISKGDDSWS